MTKRKGDFGQPGVEELSKYMEGRVIQSITQEEGMNDVLLFTFTSGAKLRIEYDYLYGWETTEPL